jgi:hypothetical protein
VAALTLGRSHHLVLDIPVVLAWKLFWQVDATDQRDQGFLDPDPVAEAERRVRLPPVFSKPTTDSKRQRNKSPARRVAFALRY